MLKQILKIIKKDSFYTDIINELIYNYENIDYVVVKKNHLNIAIEEALKVTEKELSEVVPVVANEFKAALANAQQISATSLATQDEVDESFDRLSEVMQKLSFKKGDKSDLSALIEKITKLDANDYLSSSWNIMMPILDNAKSVVANDNALEPEVQDAYEKLVRAFLQLRLKPNKDLLNELINQAESLNSSDYTTETWSPFAIALSDAKVVLNNDVATATEIETAYDGLKTAIDNLVKVTPNISNPDVSNPDNKTDNGKENSVKTGDNANLVLLETLFGGAILSIIALNKK